MTAIMQALQSGYSPKKIIDFIKRLDPSLSSKISLALQSGYSIEKVLNFLLRSGNSVNEALGSPVKEGGNLYEQAVENVHPAVAPMAKTAIGLGSVLAAPQALSALSRSLPVAAQQLIGVPGPGNPTAKAPASIPPLNAPQKQIEQQPSMNLPDLIGQMGDKVTSMVKSLSGKYQPEEIAAVLDQHILSPNQKKWLSSQTKEPLDRIVSDYLSKVQTTPEEPKKSQEIPQQESVDVGHDVMLKSGDLGKVQSIKNGIAKIDVNGKERHIKQDELEPSPLPPKDLADLLQDLLGGIEKSTGSEISRMANFVGYDPDTNELAFKPHIGAVYTYSDISPEDVKMLTSVLNQRKTSGNNYIGAWSEGSKSPIGSAMSALIRKLQAQHGGKGKEYKGKYVPVYDATEPAYKALKTKKDLESKRLKGETKKAPRKKAKIQDS